MEADAPRLLSQPMVREALRDPAFFGAMPEFTQLQSRATKLYSGTKPGDCSGCSQKREEPNMIRQFMDIALLLASGRAKGLCDYFGGTKLLLSGVHPRTRQHVHHIISP